MAKDFAGTNRLGHEAGIQAPEASSNDQLVNKFVKAWESQAARRAVKGGTGLTMALTLAACGSDSGGATITALREELGITEEDLATAEAALTTLQESATATEGELEAAEENIATLTEQRDAAEAALTTLQESATATEEELDTAEAALTTLQESATATEGELEAAEENIATLTEQRDAAEAALTTLQESATATEEELDTAEAALTTLQESAARTDLLTLTEDDETVDVTGLGDDIALTVSGLTPGGDEQTATIISDSTGKLTFNFLDADDTLTLTANGDISGFTEIEIVGGTVDLTGVDLGDVDSITVSSGVVVSIEQLSNLALGIRGGSPESEVTVVVDSDVGAAFVSAIVEAFSGQFATNGIAFKGAEGSDFTALQAAEYTAQLAEARGETSYGLADTTFTAADIEDETVAGLAEAQAKAAATTLNEVLSDEFIAGAANVDEVTVVNGAYTLADTLENLEAADDGILDGAASYSLTETAFTAADIEGGLSVSLLADAQSEAVAAVLANEVLAGASNADEVTVVNGAYTLADTLENLEGAAEGILDGATSYSLTEDAGSLGLLTAAQAAILAGAANAADYTFTQVFDLTFSSADGGQFEINDFDVATDTINLIGLTGVVADTLDDLVGQQGFGGELISIQNNPFDGSQLVNLGFDASGEVISFELGGVTQDDLSAIAVSIAGAADDGDDTAGEGDGAGADGGDADEDDGEAVVVVSGNDPIVGTDAAEEFVITVSTTDGGQFEVTNFDVVNDSVNLTGLTGVVADTLADLVGQQGFGGELISIQNDPFAGSQLVNLGFDASGEVISFELGGVTQDDLDAVELSIAGAAGDGDAAGNEGDAVEDNGDAAAGGDDAADDGDAAAGGDDAVDDQGDTAEGDGDAADEGDAGADDGDATADDGEAVVLEVSSDTAIAGTDAAEEFTITLDAADGGNFEISNFDVTNDSINLSGLTGVVADTLAELEGQQGFGGEPIFVQNNPFTGSQIVNLGFDSSGEVISFELGGVTQDDLSAVAVSIA